MPTKEENLAVWADRVAADLLDHFAITFVNSESNAGIDPKAALQSKIKYRLVATVQGRIDLDRAAAAGATEEPN